MKMGDFAMPAANGAATAPEPPGTAARTVEDDFLDPPREARPYMWWQWMGSNVTEAGIRRDIAAMAEAGIGGAVIFSNAAQCGPWAVTFEKGRGAPEGTCVVEGLRSLSTFEDPRIRHFSGTATYVKRTQFFFDSEDNLVRAEKVVLDLGDVREIAEVAVNGKACGIAWHPPFRVDITGKLHKGEDNFIEVMVTNTWRNRLIGDKREPDDCEWWVTHEDRAPHTGELLYAGRGIRAIPEFVLNDTERPSKGRVCFTVWDYFADNAPLLDAGLLGPVKLEFFRAAEGD